MNPKDLIGLAKDVGIPVFLLSVAIWAAIKQYIVGGKVYFQAREDLAAANKKYDDLLLKYMELIEKKNATPTT